MSDESPVPFAFPDIGEEEIAEVTATLRSGWLTSGARAQTFEQEFREYVQARYALAVSSCTAALHLSLAALGIGPGDEVITTPLTFCATVNCILHVGATPVLADIGDDLDIDPAAIHAMITPRTRAIIPVHMAGLPCRMDDIWQIARQHKLLVVEDAAHAVGARYRQRPIGSGPSDAVAFSFYATKNLSTGEGGMLTTPHAELAGTMRNLALHGISRDACARYGKEGSWYYEVTAPGFKYNLSDVASAIGIHQLRKLDRMNGRCREIAEAYNAAFASLDELQLPPQRHDCDHAWHLYVLRLRTEKLARDRGQIIEDLRHRGIGCSVHFIPIPLHPYFQQQLAMPDPCLRALEVYPRLLSLPLYSVMTDAQVERVITAVHKVIAGARPTVGVGLTSC